jgi:TonB-linked SusC/RagA family outer membrane protein
MENYSQSSKDFLRQKMVRTIERTCCSAMLLFALPSFAADEVVANTSPAVSVTQQASVVKGSVIDKDGPIIGATVKVKGATAGAITDINGNFTLSRVKQGDVIVVTYVGYVPKQLKYNGQSTLDITLEQDSKQLGEVVVVGYGTQKKVDLTGSVSTVDAKTIAARPVQNVGQALEGVVPGLNFSVSTYGTGGTLDSELSYNIRGTGTIGSGSTASPLVLIDGVEGDFNKMNPNDIETISVLKDAAACAIYGARASFGVILITTKSGKSGKPKIELSSSLRYTSALQVPDQMDSYHFALYYNAAAANAGQAAIFSDETLERIQQYQAGTIDYGTIASPSNPKYWIGIVGSNANTDWYHEVYKDWSPSNEENVSVSGGNDRVDYRVSFGYLHQNGLLRYGKDKFDRYSLDAKIGIKVVDWFRIKYTSKWERQDYNAPTYLNGLLFHNISRSFPNYPAYDPNGYMIDGNVNNQLVNGGRKSDQQNFYTQQMAFIFEPIKDWTINVEGNLVTSYQNTHSVILPIYNHDVNGDSYAASWSGSYAPGYSSVSDYNYKQDYFATNIYSNYIKSWGDHNFSFLAGFNAELKKYKTDSGYGEDLISSSTPYLSQTQSNFTAGGGTAEYSVAGFFGRINYNYKERYLLELNGRYDGSSRFVRGKRWGFFPSMSIGWNIAKEDFFQNWTKIFTTLKPRFSVGQLGNQSTSNWYPFYQTMSTGSQSGKWLVDGAKTNTAYMPGIVSNSLTWETIESWNWGLDWALLNNRLTGSFDTYIRYTKDMVGPAPTLASVLGTSAPSVNNCNLKSNGWELEVSWRDHIRDFSYGVKLVLSDYTTKVTKYPNETGYLGTYYAGEKLGDIWGYTSVGLAKSQSEMDTWIASNKPSWGSSWSAGDVMYKDLNGDKVVDYGSYTLSDHGDYHIIGNTTPRYQYGITLDAAWKGFDISAFFQGVGKRDYWLDGSLFWGTVSGGIWQSCAFKEHWDFWRAEDDPLGSNLNAYYPRASFDGDKNQYVQTRYLQDASYIRLKNIQVGYTFPKSITQKLCMEYLRIYVSANNIWTHSKLSGIFDPETLYAYDSGSGYGGYGKLYPLSKTVCIGLNVNF